MIEWKISLFHFINNNSQEGYPVNGPIEVQKPAEPLPRSVMFICTGALASNLLGVMVLLVSLRQVWFSWNAKAKGWVIQGSV